jgi:hypothetical protein
MAAAWSCSPCNSCLWTRHTKNQTWDARLTHRHSNQWATRSKAITWPCSFQSEQLPKGRSLDPFMTSRLAQKRGGRQQQYWVSPCNSCLWLGSARIEPGPLCWHRFLIVSVFLFKYSDVLYIFSWPVNLQIRFFLYAHCGIFNLCIVCVHLCVIFQTFVKLGQLSTFIYWVFYTLYTCPNFKPSITRHQS